MNVQRNGAKIACVGKILTVITGKFRKDA